MIVSDSTVGKRFLLARVGVHGQVGKFLTDVEHARRGARAVGRTARGVEVVQILGPTQSTFSTTDVAELLADPRGGADGRILRLMTAEDELLWNQLQSHAEQAHQACQSWLDEFHPEAILLDVEPLLDGKTVYFHFLDRIPADVQEHLDQLVAIYERQVRQSKFANLLEHGCGPKCGTAEAENGCSTRGACAVCQVAGACQK